MPDSDLLDTRLQPDQRTAGTDSNGTTSTWLVLVSTEYLIPLALQFQTCENLADCVCESFHNLLRPLAGHGNTALPKHYR
jgi:hypothetical protein